jgi:ketohexokinase
VLTRLLSHGPHHQRGLLPPIKLHLISCLPNAQAAATAKILASFGDGNDIDFSRCLYRAGHDQPASSYIMRSADTASRTIVNFNDLPDMTAREFEAIADAFATDGHGDGDGDGDGCWWHFEVRQPVISAP